MDTRTRKRSEETSAPERKAARTDGAPCVLITGGEPAQKQVRGFWRSGQFCDTTVIANGHSFAAHRLILACSDYMATRFQSAMADSNGPITLEDMDADVFDLVLTFLYDGKCSPSASQLWPLLLAASRLQIVKLIECAAIHVKELLSVENCLEAWDHVDRISHPALQSVGKTAREIATKHFDELLKTPGFISLRRPILEILLSQDTLCIGSEEDVYRAVITWLKSQPNPDYFLFNLVRFECLTKAFIQKTVRTEPLMEGKEAVILDALLLPKARQDRSLKKYSWRLSNFSSLTGKVQSDAFSLSGHKWIITCFPEGNKRKEPSVENKDLSLYLAVADAKQLVVRSPLAVDQHHAA